MWVPLPRGGPLAGSCAQILRAEDHSLGAASLPSCPLPCLPPPGSLHSRLKPLCHPVLPWDVIWLLGQTPEQLLMNCRQSCLGEPVVTPRGPVPAPAGPVPGARLLCLLDTLHSELPAWGGGGSFWVLPFPRAESTVSTACKKHLQSG